MVREIEINHIDRADSCLLQRYVIIRECLACTWLERPRIAEPVRRLPDALHDLGRVCQRKPLLLDIQVLVADHVEQHGIKGRIARRLMFGEIARAKQRLSRVAEIAVILPIHEQQIYADSRRLGLEHIRNTQQHRDTRGAVVSAWYGQSLLAEVGALIREGPRIPMRQEQDALGGLRPKLRKVVPQLERLSFAGALLEILYDDRISSRSQLTQQPIARLLMSHCIGDPGTKSHLLLHVCKCGTAAELPRG